MVVVSSNLDHLYWPSRAIYGGNTFNQRLSIFNAGDLSIIAVRDNFKYTINDVAFHPHRPVLAVAVGDYDGGYCFEGALLLWNWKDGKVENLLETNVQVLKCRFSEDGSGLTILTPPPDEGQFDDDAFKTFFVHENIKTDSRNNELKFEKPVEPAVFGFNLSADGSSVKADLKKVGRTKEREYEVRSHTWDVLWLSDEKIACVTQETILG